MPERLECEVLQKASYINTLTFYLYLLIFNDIEQPGVTLPFFFVHEANGLAYVQ